MFGFNKKDESYYIRDILKMHSCCKRECPSEKKYLKDIKNAIMTINVKKINSTYIQQVQNEISTLTFKEEKDFYTMKKVLKEWAKYHEESNKIN